MTLRYAWADVGARTFGHAPNGYWKTTTFLAGLTCEGMIAPFVLDGPINAECFFAYVEERPSERQSYDSLAAASFNPTPLIPCSQHIRDQRCHAIGSTVDSKPAAADI